MRKFSGGLVTYGVYTAYRKKLNRSPAIERKRFRQLSKAIGALLATGCGGDGSWGQRADVICDRAEKAIRGSTRPRTSATSTA